MVLRILSIVFALGFVGLAATFVIPSDSGLKIKTIEKQRGVCWVGGRQIISEAEFSSLLKNNINWISQTPFAWQSSPSDPIIRMNTSSDRSWWGESDNGISETTQLAHKINIKTLLKPHLWIRNSWPGEVKMENENAWHEWFTNYQKFIIHYAQLAEKNKIEILCVGTELTIASSHEAQWRNLIQEIRKVYSGKLTYAANFDKEYEQVEFWDALDFIGIQAYFPLSKNTNPSTEELSVSWTGHLKSIEKIQKKFNKPVIFTEIGYRSTEDAAIEPWKWPQENKDAISSDVTQARCYEAFFKSAWEKNWLAGAYFWKWYPHGEKDMMEIDFTPQGKMAEKVLSQYYKSNYDQ